MHACEYYVYIIDKRCLLYASTKGQCPCACAALSRKRPAGCFTKAWGRIHSVGYYGFHCSLSTLRAPYGGLTAPLSQLALLGHSAVRPNCKSERLNIPLAVTDHSTLAPRSSSWLGLSTQYVPALVTVSA